MGLPRRSHHLFRILRSTSVEKDMETECYWAGELGGGSFPWSSIVSCNQHLGRHCGCRLHCCNFRLELVVPFSGRLGPSDSP